jgi:hypothetical protein
VFAQILLIIEGILKFPGAITAFIQLLKGTPEEQRAKLISKIKDASQRADETQGNMDGYDDVFKG